MSLAGKLTTLGNDLKNLWAIYRPGGQLCPWQRIPVTLEISSICNLNCPLCPTGVGGIKRINRFMSTETFDRIVGVTRPISRELILSMWGEPVLHPELGVLLRKSQLLPTWIATNLNYKASIAEELARWDHLNLICAVDTLDPQEYLQYRVGGNHEVMLHNLSILANGACKVYPQFLVEEGYDHREYTDFARAYGIPPENVIIKIKRKNFTLRETNKPSLGNCHAPYLGIYFDSDGNFVPCCNDVGSDLHMGHIDHIDLKAIMRRTSIARFRQKLGRDKNQFPSCGQCNGEPFSKTRLVVYKDYISQTLSRLGGQSKGPQKMPFKEPEKNRGDKK